MSINRGYSEDEPLLAHGADATAGHKRPSIRIGPAAAVAAASAPVSALRQQSDESVISEDGDAPLLSAPASTLECVTGALLGCVMSAVGGLSIASQIFPPGTGDTHPEFMAAGLYWGLACGVVANWMLFALTRMPCGVGGTLIPAIYVIQNYAEKRIGPSEPTTVIMAYMISTASLGLSVVMLGRARVLRAAFKLVPYPVLLGFLTSIGVGLFAYALSTATPGGFARYSDVQSWRNLGAPGAPEKWLPGVLAAVLVYFLQADWSWRPPWLVSWARFLPSAVSIVMVVIVNCVPDARRNGWLAPVPTGTSPTVMFTLLPWNHFSGGGNVTAGGSVPVPPVNWELLWGNGVFAGAVIQAIIIGVLALLEDLVMVHKATAVNDPVAAGRVDLDNEVQLQGWMNVAMSLIGGVPANLVGSYSFSAMTLGGRGKVFFAAQAVFSTTILVLASHVIAIFPTMVSCFILTYVSLAMSLWGLWDVRPEGFLRGSDVGGEALHPMEYALVWAMVILSLDPIAFISPESSLRAIDKTGTLLFFCMMLLGALFAFVHTVRLLRRMSLFSIDADISTVHSDVLRTAQDEVTLRKVGAQILVLQLHRNVISFHNAGNLERELTSRVRERNELLKSNGGARAVSAVVLDMSKIERCSIDAGQMFLELLPVVVTLKISIVLCGLSEQNLHELIMSGAPLREVDVGDEHLVSGPTGLQNKAVWCSVLPLARLVDKCESALLSTPRAHRILTKTGLVTKTELNPNLASARDEFVRACPQLATHPALALLVEVHTTLNKYLAGGVVYDPSALAALASVVNVRCYAVGEVIYEARESDLGHHTAMTSGFLGHPTPPLVWLLDGAVEHYWTGVPGSDDAGGLSHASDIASAYQLSSGDGRAAPRVERAEIASATGYALGPLQTHAGFYGMMIHCGRIEAAKRTPKQAGSAVSAGGIYELNDVDGEVAFGGAVCAVLARGAFDALRRESPACGNYVDIYLARKRFINSGKMVGGMLTPKLLI